MFNRQNDKAEQVTAEANKNVHEIGRELHHHAESAKSDMVKNLYDTAKTLRKQAHEAGAPHEVADRVDEMATGFEKAASYLKGHSYGDMRADAAHTVKRYPMQTLAVIFIVGVIVGLMLRSDSGH